MESITVNNKIFQYDDYGQNAAISITVDKIEEMVTYYRITIDFAEKKVPERIKFSWTERFNDVYACWTPGGRFHNALYPSWRPADTHSRSAAGAPIFGLFSKGSENRCTFAVGDAAIPLRLTAGVEEPTGNICCTLELFTNRVDVMEHYETILRIDNTPTPYYNSIKGVRKWWTAIGYTPAEVPKLAKVAMFSSWYNFQKVIKEEPVLEQCRLAKEYGMDTVILDDGWQTDELQNGYQSCGDWEAVPSKFPNMRRFVDRLHEIDMKCILWYSVPFVGYKAKNFERFKGKYLRGKDSSGTVMILDPRFPDVREYLVNIYANAIREWDLDGMKLDFIDCFSLAEESSKDYDAMDCPSLEAAVEKLLSEVTTTLRAIKPDLMLEFRQSYIGPVMQKYGNILRVGDCAGGALINRVNSLDLRLITDTTAVHSDMLLWDYQATPEAAANQLSNILFCVPQISVLMDKLSDSHKKMLSCYLDFMAEHRDILLDGELVPLDPVANYPQVYARKENKAIAALYSNPLFTIPEGIDDLIVVNANDNTAVYLENNAAECSVQMEIRNCMDEILDNKELVLAKGVTRVEVPHNGFLYLKKKN